MLEQVPGLCRSIRGRGIRGFLVDVQLPCAVTKLRAGLADMKVADL